MQGSIVAIVLTLTLGFSFVPLVTSAQQLGRVSRIGVLVPAEAPSPEEPNIAAFRQSLNDLGYVDGQTVAMEYRYALGRIERFPDLVAELVRLQVDILVIGSGPATMAAKHITQAIPMTSPQHSSSAASPGMVGGAGEVDTALPNWSRRRQFGQGDSGLASLMVCC